MKIISKNWKLFAACTSLAALCFALFIFQGCGSDSYSNAGATAQTSSCSSTPTGADSVIINDGAVSTQSPNVMLTLHAEDTDNVAAYYLSESSTAPLAGDAGWVAISDTPCTVFNAANIAFSVTPASSVGSFPRTVYVWFKDGLNNVSLSTSDSINLIKAAAGC